MNIKSITLAVGLLLFALPLPSFASTIVWTLEGVVFDDGGTATGTFATDSTTGAVTSFNIVTTAGTALGGAAYNSSSYLAFNNYFPYPNTFAIAADNILALPFINFGFSNPLTSAGTNTLLVDINLPVEQVAFECGNNDCGADDAVVRFATEGSAIGVVEAIPEPSTWAMLIIGFAGIGFLSYRRKKQGISLRSA